MKYLFHKYEMSDKSDIKEKTCSAKEQVLFFDCKFATGKLSKTFPKETFHVRSTFHDREVISLAKGEYHRACPLGQRTNSGLFLFGIPSLWESSKMEVP